MASPKIALKVPTDTIDLITVKNKQLVFVRNQQTGVFTAKLIFTSLSPRFVSYMVHPSDHTKFHIKPRIGYLPPGHTSEVVISTNPERVHSFKDISLESFGVFAVRVYDKRQLEPKAQSVLWRAFGTDLFPYDAAEHHKIGCILPKNDTYHDDHSLLDRITPRIAGHWFSLFSKRQEERYKPRKQTLGITDEEFFAMWPSHKKSFAQMRKDNDPGLDEMIEDWHSLAGKVHLQTQALVDSFKHLVVTSLFAVSTVVGFAFWHGNGRICLWNCESSGGGSAGENVTASELVSGGGDGGGGAMDNNDGVGEDVQEAGGRNWANVFWTLGLGIGADWGDAIWAFGRRIMGR